MNLDLKYFLIYNIIANVKVLACSTHLSNLIHPRVNINMFIFCNKEICTSINIYFLDNNFFNT